MPDSTHCTIGGSFFGGLYARESWKIAACSLAELGACQYPGLANQKRETGYPRKFLLFSTFRLLLHLRTPLHVRRL